MAFSKGTVVCASAQVQPVTVATFSKFVRAGKGRCSFLEALREMKKCLPTRLLLEIEAAAPKRKGGGSSSKGGRKTTPKVVKEATDDSKAAAKITANGVVSPKQAATKPAGTQSVSAQKQTPSPPRPAPSRRRGKLSKTEVVSTAGPSSLQATQSTVRSSSRAASSSTSPQSKGVNNSQKTAMASPKAVTAAPKPSQRKRRASPEPDGLPAKRVTPPSKSAQIAPPSSVGSLSNGLSNPAEKQQQSLSQVQTTRKGLGSNKRSKGGRRGVAKAEPVTNDVETNDTEEVDDGYLAVQSPLTTDCSAPVVASQRPFWGEQYHTVEPKCYGFIGMGIMGREMAKNLLKHGHHLTIWNRHRDKCTELAKLGAKVAPTISAVVAASDITFACVSTPQASKEVFFGTNGVLAGLEPGKGYIDMSTVDPETATAIAEATSRKGAQFLEAPVCGSKKPAQNGQLIILAAGSSSLFHLASPAFDILSKKTCFLGPVGSGAKLKLIIDLMMGTVTTAFCEGMALAKKAGVSQSTVLDVLDQGSMSSLLFQGKGIAILKGQYPASFPLKHQQKDMRLALELSERVGQRVPVSAAANEHFLRAMKMDLDNNDMAAVYKAVFKT